MLKHNHWAALGALSCGLTVAIGAFGAHGLEDHFERVPRHGEIYQTAVLYQMFHSLALLIYAKAPAAFGVGCARAFSISSTASGSSSRSSSGRRRRPSPCPQLN